MAMFSKRDKPRPIATKAQTQSVDRKEDEVGLFKGGAVKLPDGSLINVIITSLDTVGARIEFSERLVLPHHLTLYEPSFRVRAAAIVLWQQEGRAGLKFVT